MSSPGGVNANEPDFGQRNIIIIIIIVIVVFIVITIIINY